MASTSLSINSNLSAAQDAFRTARDEQMLKAPGTVAIPAKGSDGEKRAEVKKIAEDFESLFLNLVLKSMRDTVNKSGLIDGGNAENIYTGMLDDEYAKMMAGQRKTGLADNIEEFLLRQIDSQRPMSELPEAGKAQGLKAYQAAGLQPDPKKARMDQDTAPNPASSSSTPAKAL